MNSKTKALKKANELGEHATETEVKELDSKLPAMKKGVIAKVWDKVLYLWELVKSPEIPTRLKVVIAGALLYLVLPIDVVPDTIPGLGLVDDLSVILAVVREVSKYAIPKIEKKLESKVYELGYQKIDGQLSKLFSSFLITTISTFCINTAGCIILITKPFGTPVSRYVSAAIFTCVFIFALIRFIIYLKNYGKMTWKIAIPVFKTKSISKGLAQFICTEYKYLDYIFFEIDHNKNLNRNNKLDIYFYPILHYSHMDYHLFHAHVIFVYNYRYLILILNYFYYILF